MQFVQLAMSLSDSLSFQCLKVHILNIGHACLYRSDPTDYLLNGLKYTLSLCLGAVVNRVDRPFFSPSYCITHNLGVALILNVMIRCRSLFQTNPLPIIPQDIVKCGLRMARLLLFQLKSTASLWLLPFAIQCGSSSPLNMTGYRTFIGDRCRFVPSGCPAALPAGSYGAAQRLLIRGVPGAGANEDWLRCTSERYDVVVVFRMSYVMYATASAILLGGLIILRKRH